MEIPQVEPANQLQMIERHTKLLAMAEHIEAACKYWALDFSHFSTGQEVKLRALGDICHFVGGSQPDKSEFVYEPRDGYIRLVQIRDFKSDDHMTYVPKKSVKKFFCEDDIMIGRYGPPLFQVFRGLSGAYNVALMKAVPNEELVTKDYLFYLLQCEEILKFVESNSQRSAGQSGVNTERLDGFQIAIPDKTEQTVIVERIKAEETTVVSMSELALSLREKAERTLASVWES
jgi:restriction endonuclease S subunit